MTSGHFFPDKIALPEAIAALLEKCRGKRRALLPRRASWWNGLGNLAEATLTWRRGGKKSPSLRSDHPPKQSELALGWTGQEAYPTTLRRRINELRVGFRRETRLVLCGRSRRCRPMRGAGSTFSGLGPAKKNRSALGHSGGTRNIDTGNWRLAREVLTTDQTEAHER